MGGVATPGAPGGGPPATAPQAPYPPPPGATRPQENQHATHTVVARLAEYATAWPPALAVMLVIVAALFGKKLVHRIAELFKKLFQGSNQQSSALIAVIRAQRALMGTNEKFSENVKELEEAEKRLEQ